jgi:hypothetical protein
VKHHVRRALLAAVGIAVGVVAVVALREATLSTHEEVAPDSRMEVVVTGRMRGDAEGQTLDELVEAQVIACHLEVSSDIVGEVEAQPDGSYRAVLTPALDQTNRRQFRGCLEDWKIDQFQLDVIRLAEVGDRTG